MPHQSACCRCVSSHSCRLLLHLCEPAMQALLAVCLDVGGGGGVKRLGSGTTAPTCSLAVVSAAGGSSRRAEAVGTAFGAGAVQHCQYGWIALPGHSALAGEMCTVHVK